jgi:signal peptidase I
VSGSDSGAASEAPGAGQAVGSETQPETVPGEAGGPAGGSERPDAGEASGAAAGSAAATGSAGDGAAAGSAGDGAAAGPGAAAEAAGAAGDGAAGSDADSGATAPPTEGGRKAKKRSFWRELPILIAIALVLAVVIKTFFIQAFWIPSGSMENTLEVNDRVLVNKLVYHIRGIARGDIVVFNGDGSWDPGSVPTSGNIFEQFANGFASMFGFGRSGDILIKRVIGLPGDHVACCDAQGRVTVNGVALNEQSYLYPGAAPSAIRFNIVVPPGRLWVMGDNRTYSEDSRLHQDDPGDGTVPESAVIGRAFIIIWPISRWRILTIPATFSQPGLSALAGSVPAGAGPSGALSGPLAGSLASLPSARLEPGSPSWPLAFGFTTAIPLTWAQRRVRMRVTRRRRRRSPSA